MMGAPFPGVAQVRQTLLDHQFSSAGGTSHAFSMNFGAARPGRLLIACVEVAVNGSISSVVIGGVTATLLALASRATTTKAALYAAVVPTGTSGNVVINVSAISIRFGCQLYTITGQRSNTPTATASDNASAAPTATLNVPSGGCVIAAAMEFAGTSTSSTWTGITEDVDDPDGTTTAVFTSASRSFVPATPVLVTTATFNGTPIGGVGAWAVWGP